MSSLKVPKTYEEAQRWPRDLEGRYRQIGISAVAAALRYQSDARNPRYAPIEPQNDGSTSFVADAAA